MTTIHDVAARAEVSTATVSRVLSNPEKVSEATRRRVLKAVHQLGYSPNAAAKSLRTLTTRKLLVTVPDIANPFFSLIIQGIEEAALREGYAVVLGDTHHDPEREERYGEMLLRREADGLIFLGHSMSKSISALMKKGQLAPIVNGCEYSPSLGVPSAHVDNEAAAYEAMSHLYGLGHRQIGIITGPLASPLSRDRLRGAQSCAKDNGAGRQVMVVNGDFSIESGIAGDSQLEGWEAADKEAVEAARDLAWDAYQKPIRKERDRVVSILRRVDTPKVAEIASTLNEANKVTRSAIISSAS